MGVKGLYLFILFRVPQRASVLSLFYLGLDRQRTNVNTVICSGASVPRAWRRWRQSKGPSPGFSALCKVLPSSSFYLSRHQILLVQSTTYHRVFFIIASPIFSCVRSFVRFALRSAPSFPRSGPRSLLLSGWAWSSPLLSSSANAKSVLCVTSL